LSCVSLTPGSHELPSPLRTSRTQIFDLTRHSFPKPPPQKKKNIGLFTFCFPCARSQKKLRSLRDSAVVAMNGTNSNNNNPPPAQVNANANMNVGAGTRVLRPPPPGPAPPAPASIPPIPPSNNSTPNPNSYTHPHPHPHPHPHSHAHQHSHPPNRINGTSGGQKGKKKPDTPVDPATMYESLKNRIAALEEEEVIEEEEERKFGGWILLFCYD
jgi:hypothetical protein